MMRLTNLGASGLTTFFRITLPLISPGIWSGFLLVFTRSLGEHTILALLYNPSNRPISIAMVNRMSEFDVGMAMAYGTLVLLLTGVGIILLRKLQAIVE